MGFDWDRYDKGDFIKFKTIGDSAVGNIVKLEHKTLGAGTANETAGPALTLMCDDGELRELFASQTGLQNLLSEKKPEMGDRIRIVYTGTHKTTGGFDAKDFTVDIMKGAGSASVAAAAPAAQAPAEAAAAPAAEQSPIF